MGALSLKFVTVQTALLLLLKLSGQTDLRFENYYIEDGLPESRTHFVYQDTYGWIWIGTEGGLSRFNGIEFKTFLNADTSHGNTNSRVGCILEDSDTKLWIGTLNHGLFLYDRSLDKFTNYRFEEGCTNCLSNNTVYSMSIDSGGRMWLATQNGLNLFDRDTKVFQHYRKTVGSEFSLSSDTLHKVFIDRSNRVWLGTHKGLNYINPATGKISRYELKNHRNTKQINTCRILDITQDMNGNILAASYLYGLYVIDSLLNQTYVILPDTNYQRSHLVKAVLADTLGNIWLGTRGGLYLLNMDFNVIAHYTNKLNDRSSIGHNSVNHVFRDRSGDLWVATRSGISYSNMNSMIFQHYRASANDPSYLNDPEVYAICEAKDGKIWFGTESGGVNILNPKTGRYTYLKHNNANGNTSASNCVKSIMEDTDGNIWIGYFLGGIDVYNPKSKRFTHYSHNPDNLNSISHNTVWDIHEDQSGYIWIGTDAGLDRFDPERRKFEHFNKILTCRSVHAIFEDSAGNMFFGSNQECLKVLQKDQTWQEYPVRARCILEDSKGRIWIGSDEDGGLVQFSLEEGIVKSYSVSDGLPSNQVYSILEDGNSNLWLGTGRGLAMFSIENEDFVTYLVNDGIQGNRFYYGSFLKHSSGELFFGGQNGVTRFDPDEVENSNETSPTVITDFRIFNKTVPIGKEFDGYVILDKAISQTEEIKIDYRHSVLTFEYVTLNYWDSEHQQYAYMLEGFEQDWNYVGTNRSANYTNLNPGTYIFKVKGTNNHGVWNEGGAVLRITIKPPFVRTIFFKILLMLLISAILYLILLFFIKREKLKNQLILERIKSKEMHKIDMMKFQFFTNISHEIRTPISLIISPLTRIRNSNLNRQQILNDLDIVYRNALRLGKLVDQLLDFRKLEAGKLKLELSRGNIITFLENIIYMFKEMSTEKMVDLRFYSALEESDVYFDSDKMEKVMFNLLSNAFKYTPEGGSIHVSVSLTYTTNHENDTDVSAEYGEFIQIVVRDTGYGIEKDKQEQIFDRFYQILTTDKKTTSGSGIGLSLSRELVKIQKGRILLNSHRNIGTEITVLIPSIKNDPTNREPDRNSDPETRPEQELHSKEEFISDGKPSLLVVEDNLELLNFIQSIFHETYTIISAEDGQSGLDQAREHIPDIIISDIMMPKMDGIKMCKKLKNDFRTSHIPIILLTALSSNQHKKEGILEGADEYITKPFDPSLLKVKVDHLLVTRKLLRDKYVRDYLLEPKESESGKISPDDKFLSRLIEIIDENLDDPEFGTMKISQEIGVSRTQLYRKMAALTDMTVKEFIRNVRLKKAAQLISQGHLNVSEIAYSVGFLQVAYFRKCFKEMYGVTPSQYTKQNK